MPLFSFSEPGGKEIPDAGPGWDMSILCRDDAFTGFTPLKCLKLKGK
jgi:hypothetical protein